MAYLTRAQLRSLNGLGDSTVHSDGDLDDGIIYAKITVDRYCGTSFGDLTTPAYDPFTVTLNGTGSHVINLRDQEGRPIMFPRTISSATIDGVADSGIGYVMYPTSRVRRDSGVWTFGSDGGQNVVISGTAGAYDTPPGDIAWAARAIARYWVLNLQSRMPDRALNLTTPEGNFEVRAQAGGVGRPTPMPDVNAVLNRHRHIWDLG